MKLLLKLGLLLLVGLFIYSGVVVFSVRKQTVETILENEKGAQYQLQVSSLTDRQLDILLLVEDPNFFNHNGIDLTSPGAGLTTITQSLAKQLYFDSFKPGLAKYKQSLLAYFVLDPLMPKEQQLTRFINKVYLGSGAEGFQEASHKYFNKRFSQLSEDEYIALVAMIIAPRTFNVKLYPERNRQRVERIKMLINGSYKPKGLCDLYYGKIDRNYVHELPIFSYFKSYYE